MQSMCVCVCALMHVCNINRFFKAVREPAIPQHSHHRGRRALQVFEGIHEDEVQHYVEEVHTNHLQRSGNSKSILLLAAAAGFQLLRHPCM